MKYMLLIHSNRQGWAARSEADRDQMQRQVADLMAEITATGEFVGGEVLADPACTITVRARDGVATATDGPYIEAKEHLAGYAVIECDGPERAVQIAARYPETEYSGVEVRRVAL